MIIDNKNSKIFSAIGSRATFGLTALELVKKYKKLQIVTSDVSTSAGLDRFKKNHTSNYVDVGIAEQNLIGVATGLSNLGFNVFTTTFAPFQTMRCLEQIKVNLGYMKTKITMVGLASGIALGNLGYTHCAIEDISVLRSIPNLTIISPADCSEVAKSTFAAADHPGPVYIRLTGTSNSKIIYNSDYNFKISEPIVLNEGDDLLIFSTGFVTGNALEAIKKAEVNNKIKIKLINVHTLKPINDKLFLNYFKNFKKIMTIEEHSIIGGLNSIISNLIAKYSISLSKFDNISLEDNYNNSGNYNYLLEKNNLSVSGIYNKILKLFNS